MPKQYIGKNGSSYSIVEPALGKGGEGSVYKINLMPDYVAKIFIENKRTESRHRKLLAMIDTPLSTSAMQQITWPVDVLYENGAFVGYVMPAIKGIEELNVMYSDKYKCTLSEYITIAKNLCAAINSVHNAGQVCGDLNPKNIGVDPRSARVTLVDTDSYHITDKKTNREYRCEVGLPEYLAREIQEKLHQNKDKDLTTLPLPTFTQETDLFALAVHIFALLMNGCHPFACAIDNNAINIQQLSFGQPSVTAPQPIDNIRNGFFPFYIRKKGITTPVYAPDFDTLPDNIKNLFIRAFVDGDKNPKKRPDAEEWYKELSIMQQNLSVCTIDSSHMYSKHLNQCPWCEIEQKMSTVQHTNKSINNTYTNTNQAHNTATATNSTNKTNNTTQNIKNKANNIKAKAKTQFAKPTKPEEKKFFIWSSIISAIITGALGFLVPFLIEAEEWAIVTITIIAPIVGVIGANIYNAYWSGFAKNGKFTGKDFFFSVLTSVGAVLAVSIAIAIIVGIGMFILAILGLVLAIVIIGALISGG